MNLTEVMKRNTFIKTINSIFGHKLDNLETVVERRPFITDNLDHSSPLPAGTLAHVVQQTYLFNSAVAQIAKKNKFGSL